MPENTLLILEGVGVTPYSARGIKEKLEPVEASVHLARTVNGSLINMSAPQMKKYKISLTGEDQDPPSFSGIWPGAVIVVSCISELSYLTINSTLAERPAVEGSERVEGDFTFYRPIIEAMVEGLSVEKDEWGAVISWDMALQET